jgi:YbbR domain-containing protein
MNLKTSSFRKNYKSIIGVVLLAFLLWFMVKMNRVYEYAMNIPIRFVNLDENKIFRQPQVKTVRVEFIGKGKDLIRLHFYKAYYEIDLSGSPLHFEMDISEHPEYVNFPEALDVRVKSIIRPRTISVDLDEKMVEKLPVVVKYELTEPPGYILVKVVSDPDSVQVTGPKVMFRNVDQVLTEEKKFKEISRAFSEMFKIKPITNYFVEYDPKSVKVTFDIQRLAEKEILDVPVTIIDKPKNLQVIPLPSTATIYVKGGEAILADLDMKDFQIIIDFRKEWKPGVQKVKADLVTNAPVLYMETRPPQFELIVQKKRTD